MKISELKENWEKVREHISKKNPYILCVLIERDIEVTGDNVTIYYMHGEDMLKRIAQKYIGVIYEGIRELVEDEFTLFIKMEEENGEN